MWHVMRYYAHFGHTDFILCLGYGASYVKDFFLNYDETRSNDFVLEGAAREVKLFKTDISDWRITFVDTGLNSAIGERLRRVRRFVEDEPMFLANYADVFTDASLPDMIARFEASSEVVSLLAVPPQSSHHVVDVGRGRSDHAGHPRPGPASVGERRLFRAPAGNLRPSQRRRRPRRGRDSATDPAAAGHRLPVQGLLVTRRHGEGTRATRGDVPPGAVPVDGMGSGTLRCEQERHDRDRHRRLAAVICHAVIAPECPADGPLSVLAIGAHPDDIEIGAGGLLLQLAEGEPRVRYVVLTGISGSTTKITAAKINASVNSSSLITLFTKW